MYSLTWPHQCSIESFHALLSVLAYPCYVYIVLNIVSAILTVVDLDISVGLMRVILKPQTVKASQTYTHLMTNILFT